MRVPSVDHVRIASNPPTSLIMRVDLSIGPWSAPVALDLSPVATNGHVQTRLISTEVAGVPIPPHLAGLVTDAINRRIAALPGGKGQATGVRVLPSGLEILANYP
jgi:hypothetical protein